MKKALLAIAAAVLALIILFIRIGGVFDKPFWLAFLPGLLANLIILAVAVFVIDRIFQQDRWRKLEQINAKKSEFVLFLTNRMAFFLLESAGLANSDEITKDTMLKFQFAMERMKTVQLEDVLFDRFKTSKDRQAFVDGLVKNLNDGAEGVSKALDAIYPHPDPSVKTLIDDFAYLSGTISGFGALNAGIVEANKRVQPDQQLKPDQIDLLLQLGYSLTGKPIVLWLGEACGLPKSKVRAAMKAALAGSSALPAQCSAIRKVIPWELIEGRLKNL